MQTNTFRLVTTGSITGLVLVTALTTSSATSKYASWWKQERERSEAENAKAIADTYRENQIAHFEELIVNNYTLNNTPPRLDWQHSVDPSKWIQACSQLSESDIEGLIEATTSQIRGKVYASRTEEWEVVVVTDCVPSH